MSAKTRSSGAMSRARSDAPIVLPLPLPVVVPIDRVGARPSVPIERRASPKPPKSMPRGRMKIGVAYSPATLRAYQESRRHIDLACDLRVDWMLTLAPASFPIVTGANRHGSAERMLPTRTYVCDLRYPLDGKIARVTVAPMHVGHAESVSVGYLLHQIARAYAVVEQDEATYKMTRPLDALWFEGIVIHDNVLRVIVGW